MGGAPHLPAVEAIGRSTEKPPAWGLRLHLQAATAERLGLGWQRQKRGWGWGWGWGGGGREAGLGRWRLRMEAAAGCVFFSERTKMRGGS